MSFNFFVVLNAVLFIRPGDLMESLAPFQLYQLAILGCLATTYPAVLAQLNSAALAKRPATVTVLGIFAVIVLSHLQFGSIYEARTSGFDFGKIVLYFLLLQTNLDTPEKFQRFLTWVVTFTLIAATLALAQYHNLVDIPALAAYEQREIDEETGESIVFPRLCGAGIFNDPNDVCLMLSMSIMICLYRLNTPGAGSKRFLWMLPVVLFVVAFLETKSRGGMLGLMAALNVLLISRKGLRKALPLWALGAPVVLVLAGGRMTKIDTEGGTGQERVQLWREALGLVREYPILGVGQGNLPDHLGLVAHNSYVHSFAELGLVGGTCFIGTVYLAVAQLLALRKHEDAIPDPEMRRLRDYLLGIISGFCVGLFSLSRCYIVPTYLVFGLSAAFSQHVQVQNEAESPVWKFDSAMAVKLVKISLVTLVFLEVSSRLMVRY